MTEETTPTPESTTPVDTPSPPEAAPAPEASKRKASSVNNPYVWGTGRRKSSVARVRIKPGEGKFIINKREVDEYFRVDRHRQEAREPLNITDAAKSFDVYVNVGGGGITGQAGAVSLGLARALAKADRSHEPKLRERNLLSRDPRKVERKKYGQRGARRRFQFSKR